MNVWDLIACAGAHCSHQRMCIGTPMQCPLSRQSNLAIKAPTHIGLRLFLDCQKSCCHLELCFIFQPSGCHRPLKRPIKVQVLDRKQ